MEVVYFENLRAANCSYSQNSSESTCVYERCKTCALVIVVSYDERNQRNRGFHSKLPPIKTSQVE